MKIKIRELMLFCFVLVFTSCSCGIDQSDIIAPGAVTELSSVESEYSVCLTWINPEDSDFDHVEIIATQTDSSLQVVNVETENRTIKTCTITGLISDKEYTFSVKAVDIKGNMSESCDKIISTIADEGTFLGITPPSWLSGTTWACIRIDDDIVDFSFEFTSEDIIMKSIKPESFRDDQFPDEPVSSYYNSTEFKISVYDEGFINFESISDNLLSFCFMGEGGSESPSLLAPVSKQVTTQGINPPSWLINTYWSGSFTDTNDDLIDVSYSFTEDNLESTVGVNYVNYKEQQVATSSLGITSISSPIQYEIILSETINSDNRRKILFTRTLEDDKINCVFCNDEGEVINNFDLTLNTI